MVALLSLVKERKQNALRMLGELGPHQALCSSFAAAPHVGDGIALGIG